MARSLPVPGRRGETGRYMRATTAAILLLLGLAGTSEAHELWVEEASGEPVLRDGHGPGLGERPGANRTPHHAILSLPAEAK